MLMYDTFGIFPVRYIHLNYVYVFARNRGTTIKRFIGEHEGSKRFQINEVRRRKINLTF